MHYYAAVKDNDLKASAGGIDTSEYCPVLYTSRSVTKFTIPLDKEIKRVSLYRDALRVLEEAGPDDEVEIIINTPGGSLNTTITMINAIQNCQGRVVGKVVGLAASGGSLVALSCPEIVLMPYSQLMIHPASGGLEGTVQDMFTSGQFALTEVVRLYRDVYTGFLDEAEMASVIDGNKELWFNDEASAERLTRMFELRAQQAEGEQFAEED